MISIIVPAYNVEVYVGKAIKSILNQTYSELEVIIVNDGSTDGTGKVINQYALQYPKKIRAIHTENKGVTAARLTGVVASKGEWIGFVDADDEIEPDMYEVLVTNALKYRADISHCGYQMIFSDGRVNYFHNTGCLVKQDRTTGLKDLLDGSLVEPGLWNKLFRKTLFHSLLHQRKMNTDIKINEDLLMNYILFSQANLSVFEDICKYHYIVREGSATRTNMNEHRIYDPIRVKQHILNMGIIGMEKEASKAYLVTCINVYNSLMLENTKNYIDDEKNIRKMIVMHKSWIKMLSRKQKILAYMIYVIPFGYKPIYRFYAKHLLCSKYD